MKNRKALTLVELVFSIVIVGIAVMSIPIIVRNSNANTLQSKNAIGYYNALTLIDTIKSKPWDTNNISDFENSGIYYILYTGNNSIDCYLEVGSTPQIYVKQGLGKTDRRRICDPNKKRATPITPSNRLDSINAFHGYRQEVKVGNTTMFILSTKIEYVDVNFANGTNIDITNSRGITNVKKITVTLSKPRLDSNGEEAISSYIYYAANIGTDVPASKDN